MTEEARPWFYPLATCSATRIVPVVTYALIAINVAVFLVEQQQGDDFTLALAATPYEITHNEDLAEPVDQAGASAGARPVRRRALGRAAQERPHAPCPIPVRFTLLTSMFLHGSWMHLLGNMLYLWIVGDNVEEVLGSVRYLVVYLACGLVGSLAQILVNPDSITPTLGALGSDCRHDGGVRHLVSAQPDPGLAIPVHHRAAGHRRDRGLDRASDLSGWRRPAPGRRLRWGRLPRSRRRCA